jgi:hypothetical protein
MVVVQITEEIINDVVEKMRVAFGSLPIYEKLIAPKVTKIVKDIHNHEVDTKMSQKFVERYYDVQEFKKTEHGILILAELQIAIRCIYVLILSHQEECIEKFWTDTSQLLENYREFEKDDFTELGYLLNFRNMMALSLEFIPAKLNKRLLVNICARLEGSGNEYVTGGGQKQPVTNRCIIYEREGNVSKVTRPEPRAKRTNTGTDGKRKAVNPTLKKVKMLRLASDEFKLLDRLPLPVPSRMASLASNVSRSCSSSSVRPNGDTPKKSLTIPKDASKIAPIVVNPANTTTTTTSSSSTSKPIFYPTGGPTTTSNSTKRGFFENKNELEIMQQNIARNSNNNNNHNHNPFSNGSNLSNTLGFFPTNCELQNAQNDFLKLGQDSFTGRINNCVGINSIPPNYSIPGFEFPKAPVSGQFVQLQQQQQFNQPNFAQLPVDTYDITGGKGVNAPPPPSYIGETAAAAVADGGNGEFGEEEVLMDESDFLFNLPDGLLSRQQSEWVNQLDPTMFDGVPDNPVRTMARSVTQDFQTREFQEALQTLLFATYQNENN